MWRQLSHCGAVQEAGGGIYGEEKTTINVVGGSSVAYNTAEVRGRGGTRHVACLAQMYMLVVTAVNPGENLMAWYWHLA